MAKQIKYRWNGTAWEPLADFVQQCTAFAVGQIAAFKEDKERAEESHRHYFACVREAWRQRPEYLVDRFGTDEKQGADKLRKWCLIKAGFCDRRIFVAASTEQALAYVANAGWIDDSVVSFIEGNVVTTLRARTQKMKKSGEDGMDKKDFEASKEAVLRECAHLVGVDVASLEEQARRAA